ncbi:iron-containing alcohol dehydrogenase [Candidatus Latescibacterota bacterium]
MIPSFAFSRIPMIHFGAGTFGMLDSVISSMGSKPLIVSGSHSFESSGKKDILEHALRKKSFAPIFFSVKGEPSPDLVDNAVSLFRNSGIDVVCAVGGGSVIDAGKAISAMLLHDDSVFDYLEGVGKGEKHDGVKIPFIAVPTTAGTGSEATKNAVLSRVGPEGFKKSLRHDNLVPDAALIDPELTLSCPPDITAATGMDAFSQLLEACVSTRSNPMTDALAYSGLSSAIDMLIPVCTSGSGVVEVRAGMAYAALISGIAIANAGLGTVHGLASALGGLFDIPHGVVCGTLVGAWAKITIEKLKRETDDRELALQKFARAGALIAGGDERDLDRSCELLVQKLMEWIDILHIPTLSSFGIKESDIDSILNKTDNKNNPVTLDRSEIRRIIEVRL